MEYLLDAGAEAGVKIWLGLYLNESCNSFNWWDAVNDNTIDAADQAIIDYHVERSILVLNELFDKYGSHAALGGFYYPVEVGNLGFMNETAWPALAALLDRVADAVHERNPGMKLAISPFFNTNLTAPQPYADMWSYALKNSDIDIVMLQDGAGVDPAVLDDTTDLITPWYSALSQVTRAAGKELWANVELFTNRGTRAKPDLVPSSIERVRRQLLAAAPYVDRFVGFEFHYMDPNADYAFDRPRGGDAATDAAMRKTLHDEYMAYLKTLQ